MKKTTLLFFSLSLLLTACFSPNNETEEEQSTTVQEEENEASSEKNSVNISIGEDSNIKIDEKSMKNLEEGLEKMADAFKNLDVEIESDIEAVDFRELKKALPSSIGWMKRTEFGGEKAGAFGLKTSTANATYESGDKEIRISVVDIGGFKAALAGLAVWSNIEVDKETMDGYERTTMIDGYKAFEKYNGKREEGELSVILEDRIVISIEGENIDDDDLRKALKKIDVDDLADIAKSEQ